MFIINLAFVTLALTMLTCQKTLILCLVVVSFKATAQTKNTYFLKNSGQYVSKLDSADFIRVIKEPDPGSALYNVFDFYPKGQGKLEGKSRTKDPVSFEGKVFSYYPNGNRKRVAEYKKNRLTGDDCNYFPNGKLYYIKHYSNPDSLTSDKKQVQQTVLLQACNDSTGKSLAANGNGYFLAYNDDFKTIFEEGNIKDGKPTGDWKGYEPVFNTRFAETYNNGQLLAGTAIDPLGRSFTYKSRVVQPQYKDGMAAFYKFLGQTIRYPAVDREDHIQGTVILKFIIGKDGALKDINVFRSVSRAINAEAVRVLNLSAGSWVPRSYYGRVIDYPFVVPITFNLSN